MKLTMKTRIGDEKREIEITQQIKQRQIDKLIREYIYDSLMKIEQIIHL